MALDSEIDSFEEFHQETDKKGLVIKWDNQVEGVFGTQVGNRNVSFYTKGGQIGIKNLTQKIDGYQIGLSNSVDKELNGIQVGLICQATSGNFKQFGLITIRNDSELPWYKSISPFYGSYKSR